LDFPDDHQVQGGPQTPGDLRSHRHSAGGNGEQVDLLALIIGQGRQLLAGHGPVEKNVDAVP
jgi:hypothetical protein